MELAIRESIYGSASIHMCVSKEMEDSCTDWNIQRGIRCPGCDIDGGVYMPEGITKCQDRCLANRPTCVGLTYSNDEMVCYIKSCLTGCKDDLPQRTSAALVHYNCLDNHDCGNSFVQMSDNNFGLIGQKKTYCGRDTPENFYSIGNKMTVRVQVGSSTSGAPEFRATYKAEVCNRIHTEKDGVILSPAYPGEYPANLDCKIQIQLKDNGLKLAIFFTDFELESSNQCSADYLQIDNGEKLCGTDLPLPVFKQTATAVLSFHTNNVNQARGFKIDYTSSYDGCGGILTGYKGNVYSTPYPEAYSPNMRCRWQIVVPEGKKIELKFNDVHVRTAEDQNCLQDENIKVYQATQDNPTSKLLKTVCGLEKSDVRTLTNLLTIDFVSQNDQSSPPNAPDGQPWNGFFASYTTY